MCDKQQNPRYIICYLCSHNDYEFPHKYLSSKSHQLQYNVVQHNIHVYSKSVFCSICSRICVDIKCTLPCRKMWLLKKKHMKSVWRWQPTKMAVTDVLFAVIWSWQNDDSKKAGRKMFREHRNAIHSISRKNQSLREVSGLSSVA